MQRTIDNIIEEFEEKNPHILFVSSWDPRSIEGGLPRYLDALSREIAVQYPKVSVSFLSREYSSLILKEGHPNITYNSVNYGSNDSKVSLLNPINNFNMFVEALKLVNEADIVHIHDPLEISSVWVGLAAKLLKKPVVLTPHAGLGYLDNTSKKGSIHMGFSYGMNALGNSISAYITRSSAELTKKDGIFVGQFVPDNFDIYKNEVKDEQISEKLEDFIGTRRPVLQIGTFNSRKNQLTTLNAFKNLIEYNNDACLLLIGDHGNKKYVSEINQYIQDNELETRVLMIEAVPHESMPSVYSKIKEKRGVLCLPSTGEGFPLVMLEAMGYGIPIIATERDGMKDAIDIGVDGFLINDPHDTNGFSEAMKSLFNTQNSELYENMCHATYEKSKKFAVKFHLEKLMLLYAHSIGIDVPTSNAGLPYLEGTIELSDHVQYKPTNF